MLFLLLALHVACGLAALLGARRLGRRALLVGVVAPAAVVVWLAGVVGGVLDGDPVTASAAWVPALGLGVDLRLDAFAALMVVLVSGIGVLVFAYGWHYVAGSASAGRVAGLLTLFAGSMLGVVLADNLLVLYVFWELTSITSYLLIGVNDREPEARAAALHALLVTALGGLAMLGGFVVLGQQAGTFRLSALVAAPPSGTLTAVALVLVLLGAFTKSAQYPFHSWLPGAMVAPTPISAYLHSAAMVKAGVYLIARLAPAFAGVGVWRPLVVTVGLLTMVAGGLRALRPVDLKQLLAFGTISQLGFLTVLFGIGRPAATAAGCALLLAHGFFKAALFMVVGIVDHETHTRDIGALPALGPGWGPTRWVAFASAASMAAVPPLAGFVAKEEAYGALVDGTGGDRLVLAGIVAGSVLTVAYSLRFACALWRPNLVSEVPHDRAATPHAPRLGFVAPAAVLAAGSVVFGVAPALWSPLVDHAAQALDAGAHAHLQLWHGVTPALVLSLGTLAAGLLAFLARRRVAAVQSRLAPPVTGLAAYEAAVRGTLRLAGRVTSVAQSGSLPIYAAVILTTAAVSSVAALVTGAWWSGWPDAIGRPAHIPIAGLLTAGGVAATVVRRRFAAALLLGVVGYGMALLFVVQGAPDLALTQFAVETLSVLVFLLVLRQLPDRFERSTPAVARVIRLGVSTLVGVFVVVMALATSGARTEAPVSWEMSARALPEGDGRNVVNVILVDIRGMDTVGEITVLVAAAIGVTALARAGRTPRPPLPRRAGGGGGPGGGRRAGGRRAGGRRAGAPVAPVAPVGTVGPAVGSEAPLP
jgi:multicomponent Na+:H+ antiporter subunit A